MQKHPMLSVKEAAAALGCDERWIREKLNQGLMKGEKRNIGLKEKWFVYKGEVDAAVAKKTGQQHSKLMREDSSEVSYFGVDDGESIDAEVQTEPAEQTSVSPVLEELVRVIANQFAERLDQQKDVAFRLQRELEQKEQQLRLLPDLQKQLAEAQNKELELIALQKQLAAMEQERRESQVALERMQTLETVVPSLEQQLAAEKLAKEQELGKLEAKLAELEADKLEAEAARRRVSELEDNMSRLRQEEAERQDRANREIEELKRQKDEQDKTIQDQIGALQTELNRLKEPPWWKKFLGFGNSPESGV